MINNFYSNIKNVIKNLDKKAVNILKKGLLFCFFLSILSTIILITYQLNNFPITFKIGINLFKASLIFATEFIICAIAVDRIKKQII